MHTAVHGACGAFCIDLTAKYDIFLASPPQIFGHVPPRHTFAAAPDLLSTTANSGATVVVHNSRAGAKTAVQSVEWWGPASLTLQVGSPMLKIVSVLSQTAIITRTVEGLYYMHAVQKIQSCYDRLRIQKSKYDIFIDRDYLKE